MDMSYSWRGNVRQDSFVGQIEANFRFTRSKPLGKCTWMNIGMSNSVELITESSSFTWKDISSSSGRFGDAQCYFVHFCKSLLCSMFYELTCSRFTRLVVCRLSPCPKYLIKPYNAIFLKSPGSKDIKTDIPNCQIHKYKFTNTRIQFMMKRQGQNLTTQPGGSQFGGNEKTNLLEE